MINIVGMDPSLSNWGLAYAQYSLKTGKFVVKKLELVQTQKSKTKQIRVNHDDMMRVYALSHRAFHAVQKAHVVFAELPVGSQSARAMLSYGAAIGILSSLKANNHIVIGVLPDDIKLATIGNKTASKAAIIKRAVKNWPKLDWPKNTQKGKTTLTASKCEHLADAIGAIEAGIHTSEFQQLLTLHSRTST